VHGDRRQLLVVELHRLRAELCAARRLHPATPRRVGDEVTGDTQQPANRRAARAVILPTLFQRARKHLSDGVKADLRQTDLQFDEAHIPGAICSHSHFRSPRLSRASRDSDEQAADPIPDAAAPFEWLDRVAGEAATAALHAGDC